MKKTEEEIQSELLAQFPLGSKIDEVEKGLRVRGIQPQVSKNAGFLKQQKGDSRVIGSQSIRSHLGDYRSSIFLVTSVTAFFAFNNQDELIDIWVWKTTDGP